MLEIGDSRSTSLSGHSNRDNWVASSSPDTGASLTLVSSRIVDEAGLQPAGKETVATAAGMVKMRTFGASIELPVGRYDAIVASSEIPQALPFQILLGRNILDLVDLYALGKSKVVCLKDP
jgi:predicted aspartyl protease